MQPSNDQRPLTTVRRPTILNLSPRHYRIVDTRFVPIGQDYRWGGMALVIISIAFFFFMDVDLNIAPLLPSMAIGMGVFGVLIVVRAPLRRVRELLLDLDLSAGLFHGPIRSTNGSGTGFVEWEVSEVDELLFAMREVPLEGVYPKGVTVDGFALYVRLFDGTLVPAIEACFDHDRTFKVARFLSEAFDVGIKQVGKGWRE